MIPTMCDHRYYVPRGLSPLRGGTYLFAPSRSSALRRRLSPRSCRVPLFASRRSARNGTCRVLVVSRPSPTQSRLVRPVQAIGLSGRLNPSPSHAAKSTLVGSAKAYAEWLESGLCTLTHFKPSQIQRGRARTLPSQSNLIQASQCVEARSCSVNARRARKCRRRLPATSLAELRTTRMDCPS